MSRRLAWVWLGCLAAAGCLAEFRVGDDAADAGTGSATATDESGDTGSCEVNCDPQREVCERDQCLCRSGLTRCGDVCVDLESDPAHCGDCATACGADVCEAGECRPGDCQEDELTNCSGACVDTDTNPLHCNGCDRPCNGNELCIDANCRDFAPGDCGSDDDCDSDRKCCPSEDSQSMVCLEGDECP